MAKVSKIICDMGQCESTFDVVPVKIYFGAEILFEADMCRNCREQIKNNVKELSKNKR